MSAKGPRYYRDDPKPYCRWCDEEIDPLDELAMRTGYCSSKCYEMSVMDDEEEEDFNREIDSKWNNVEEEE